MTKPIQSYCLVGRRVDIWPVAAILARQLSPETSITVCEDQDDGSEEFAAVPLSDPFFAMLDVDATTLANAGAGFALGYALEGFAGEGSQGIAAPSGDLPGVGGLAFHHILRRVASEAGALDRFATLHEGFRFCARAAREGRMALPGDAPNSPLAMLGPLVVISRGKLADLLEETVPRKRISTGSVGDTDFTIDLRAGSQTGEIIKLPILAEARIEADYASGPMPRYRLGGSDTQQRFALRDPWQCKRLYLGPASASLGPLFSGDTRLLLAQAVHLMQCLPSDDEATAESRRFNYLHRQSVERLYEVLSAPLYLGLGQQADPPDGLALRIEQFCSRGRMPEFDGEVVDRQFWIDLLLAFGVVPERQDRRADAFDPRQLDRALGTIRGQLEQSLASMPSAGQFVKRFGDR